MHGGYRNTKFWSENLKGGHLFEDLGVDGRVMLKWNLNRMGGCGMD
jgi:hypothetical protein